MNIDIRSTINLTNLNANPLPPRTNNALAKTQDAYNEEVKAQAEAYTGILFAEMLSTCFGEGEEGFLGGGQVGDLYKSRYLAQVGEELANSPLGRELTDANYKMLQAKSAQLAPQMAHTYDKNKKQG